MDKFYSSKLLIKVIFAVLLFFLIVTLYLRKNNISHAPDYRAKTLNHETFFLNEYKGKVVVLFFWTTWCPVCRNELLDLNEIYKRYKDEGLVVAGINCDKGNIDYVSEISQKYRLDYPIVLDNGEIMKLYNIMGMPTTVLIDRNQNIRWTHGGYDKSIARRINDEIESLIKKE